MSELNVVISRLTKLPFDMIKTNGYDKKVCVSPLNDKRINELSLINIHKSFDIVPVVIYNDVDKNYSIVDDAGQHMYCALQKKIKTGLRKKSEVIKCHVMYENKIRRLMKISNENDVITALKFSYNRKYN